VPIPVRRCLLGDPAVQRQSVDVEILKVFGAGIRGAAQEHRAAIWAREERQNRVFAHVGIDRDRIGAVAIESLARIHLGRVADVATLGVEQHDGRGRSFADVANARGELGFGAHRAVERDLRFISRRDVECRIDDAPVER
jgi:hypothetical protein